MTRIPGIDRIQAGQIEQARTTLPGVTEFRGLDAPGKALTELGGAVSGAGDVMAELGARVQLGDEKRDLQEQVRLYRENLVNHTRGNPELGIQGIRELQGQAAVDAEEGIRDQLNKDLQTQAEGITTEWVKDAFLQQSAGYRDETFSGIRGYAIGQRQVARDRANKSELKQITDELVLDPDKADVVAGQIEIVVRKQAENQGIVDEDVFNRLLAVEVTAAHKAVIDAFQLNGDNHSAEEYFKVYKDAMPPGERAKAAKAIRLAKDGEAIQFNSQVDDLVDVMSAGFEPNSDKLAFVEAWLSAPGSTKQKAKQKEKLRKAKLDKRVLTEVNATTTAEQDHLIAQLTNVMRQKTATADQVRVLQKLRTSREATRKAIDGGDGLSRAAEIGVIRAVGGLVFDDVNSYRARSVQAEQASNSFGETVSPLVSSEVKALIEVFTGAKGSSPDAASAAMAALAEGLTTDEVSQVAKKAATSAPWAAVAIDMAATDPVMSSEIILGGRALAEGEKAPSVDERNRVASDVLEDVFSGGAADQRGDYLDAADALYVGRASSKGLEAFDEDIYEQSLRDVIGGEVIETGDAVSVGSGKILPPAPGVDQSTFDAGVENITAKALVKYSVDGGIPVHRDGTTFDASELNAGVFSMSASFVNTGPGTYAIEVPGLGIVQSSTGEVYHMDLRDYFKSGDAASPLEFPHSDVFHDPLTTMDGRSFAEDLAISNVLTSPETIATVDERNLMEGKVFSPASRKYEQPEAVTRVLSTLGVSEGDGDYLTTIPTDEGITPGARSDAARLMGRNDLTNEEVKKVVAADSFKQLDDKFENFSEISVAAQAVLVDLSFNLGVGRVKDFTGVKAGIAALDNVAVAKETLDTAKVNGKLVRGLSARRARGYNTVAEEEGVPVIASIEQTATAVIYRDANGNTISTHAGKRDTRVLTREDGIIYEVSPIGFINPEGDEISAPAVLGRGN